MWAAGVFDWAPADQADPEAWQLLLTTNLTAAAVPTALVLPQLIEAAPSALVYIGSGAGRRVYANNAAYVASKHGLAGLAGLAGATFLDVRDRGVKVSVVSPGLVGGGRRAAVRGGQATPRCVARSRRRRCRGPLRRHVPGDRLPHGDRTAAATDPAGQPRPPPPTATSSCLFDSRTRYDDDGLSTAMDRSRSEGRSPAGRASQNSSVGSNLTVSGSLAT